MTRVIVYAALMVVSVAGKPPLSLPAPLYH